MSLLSFNPFQYAERLQKTGLDAEIAKEIASAQMEVIRQLMEEKLAAKEDLTKLATKEDLKNLVTKEDLLSVKSDLLEKFVTKSEMRWIFGVTTTILALLMTALKVFH